LDNLQVGASFTRLDKSVVEQTRESDLLGCPIVKEG